MKGTNQCLACGRKGASKLFSAMDYNYRTDEKEYEVFRCSGCGLTWLPAAPKDLGRYYGSNYALPPAPDRTAVSFARKLGRFLKPNRNPIFKAVIGSGHRKVLDVGCGDGFVMSRLRDAGPSMEIIGIEQRGPAADVARARGFKVLAGDFYTVARRLPNSSFDLIVLNHVFEHLGDPARALSEFSRLLADRGEVIIVVPNMDGVSCRLFGKWAEPYDVPRHLVGFSVGALTALAGKAGFTAHTLTFSENTYLFMSLLNMLNIRRTSYYSLRKERALNLVLKPIGIFSGFCVSWLAMLPDALGMGDQIFARLGKAPQRED